MWIKVSTHRAINIDTGTSLEVVEGEQLVYKNKYIFGNTLYVGRSLKWQKTGEWFLCLGTGETIRQGTEQQCLDVFNTVLRKNYQKSDFLDFS